MEIDIKDFFANSFCLTIDYGRLQHFNHIFTRCFSFDGYEMPRAFWGFVNWDLSPFRRCALGHIAMMKMAKAMDFPFIAIFEDDAYPCADIEHKLAITLKNIPDDAEVVILGYNQITGYASKHNDFFSQLNSDCWGTHAYLVTRKGYDSFLKVYNKNPVLPADHYFRRINKVYVPNQNLFIQLTLTKSMNGYTGYVVKSTSLKTAPSGFYPLNHISRSADSEMKLNTWLSKLGEFVYDVNEESEGSLLMASQDFKKFDNMGVKYHVLTNQNRAPLTSREFNLVFSGGLMDDMRKAQMDKYIKNPCMKKCIVLPSVFYECDDMVKNFDERFIVFCSNLKSYEYCTSKNGRAQFYLWNNHEQKK